MSRETNGAEPMHVIYQAGAGVLDDFAQGHSKQVAARHYADIDAHTQLHEDAIEAFHLPASPPAAA